MGRKEVLRTECESNGFTLDWYSPGDGLTRYRFFPGKNSDPRSDRVDYFAGWGDFTALGWKEAVAYASGRVHGVQQERAKCEEATS